MVEHIDHIPFSPYAPVSAVLVEESVVAVFAFGDVPFVEILAHHHKAHFVAELDQFFCRHIVRGADGVAAHILENCELAADGSFIDNPKYQKLNEELEKLASKYQVTKNAIAISWILRHPANIIPILGTTSVSHLHELVKAKDISLERKEWYSLYLAAGHYLP